MTIEDLASNSLVVEDVPNPGTVSYSPDPKPEPKAPTAREAIEKSLADIEKTSGKKIPEVGEEDTAPKDKPKVEDKPKPEKVEEKPVPQRQEEVERQDDDTAPDKPVKADREVDRAPDNFLPRAKERWVETPEEVRGEVLRMKQNFEKGKMEYEESHNFRKEMKPYEDWAKQRGVPLKEAFQNFVSIDHQLRTNPEQGLNAVFQAVGIDPVQYAQYVLNRAGQEQQNPALAQTRQLEQKVQQLTQYIQTAEQAKAQEAQQQKYRMAEQQVVADIITPFRESLGDNDRYVELQDDIAFFLNSGKIPFDLSAQQRLEEAYYMAERLNPAPNSPSRAQRPKNSAGEKSIKGSMSGNISSNTGAKLNGREAIEAAMDRMGLR